MIANTRTNTCGHEKKWTVYSQKDLASAVGVDPSTVAQWVRAGLPRVSAGKNRYAYCIPCAVAKRLESAPVDRGSQSLDDLIAAGGDSPNLERLRLAKAQLAEMELAAKRKSVMPRDMARSALGRVASLWRRYGERLGKRHGPEELASFNETLCEAQQVIDDEFGGDGLPTGNA